MKRMLSIVDSKPEQSKKQVTAKSALSPYIEQIKKEKINEETERKSKVNVLSERVIEKMYAEDKIDSITVDIPLLIRLLEYAKEDAKTDMDLHKVAENLTKLSKKIPTLTMKHYN